MTYYDEEEKLQREDMWWKGRNAGFIDATFRNQSVIEEGVISLTRKILLRGIPNSVCEQEEQNWHYNLGYEIGYKEGGGRRFK